MSERLMMEGKLLHLERDANALRYRMDGLCTLIRGMLNTALTSHEDMEVASSATHMDELVMAQAELLAITSRIRKLEKELGR